MSRREQREEKEDLLLGLLSSSLPFLLLEFSKSISDLKLLLVLLIFGKVQIKKKEASINHQRRISAVLAYCTDFLKQDFWSRFVGSCG